MNKISHILISIFILQTFVLSTFAQQGLVSGVVVDKEGISLPGVSILIKGTMNGTISSIDGKYALTGVKASDTIQFSFVGFQTVERPINSNAVINVIMEESTEMLEDVQVVAFQKQRKESVIGSINTIKPSELKQPTSNLTTALAGKMSGVIAYQRSGEPGKDNAEFFVRGVTSFGYKNSPLILIDGLEVSSEDLARIEPDNIETFSIMKDATATAIYGSKGANGVIYITTKEGRKGKARVAFRLENSVSTPTKMNEFLDGVDYMKLYNQAERTRDPNAQGKYTLLKIEGTENEVNPELYPNVNWYDELFTNMAINRKANLNVNGGGEIAQYYLSASYTNEKGLLKVDPLNDFNNNIDINRYNLRANVNIDLTKTTTIKVKFSSLFDKYNGPAVEANNIFGYVMQANPVDFSKYFEKNSITQYYNHTLFGYRPGSFDASRPNPYAEMVKGYKDRLSSTILSLAQIEQDLGFITKGLKMRGMISVRTYNSNEVIRTYVPYLYSLDQDQSGTGQLFFNQVQEGTEYFNATTVNAYGNSKFYFEGIAQYDRTIFDKHTLGGLLVYYQSEALNTDAGRSYLQSLPKRNQGISGRFTYGFLSRYFTEFNFGYNGSERFHKDHRFGFFPSVGVGWIVSNENFFESLNPYINLFKLKYSYGKVGKDEISSDDDRFFYMSEVSLEDGSKSYVFGENFNNYYNGYTVSRYANPLVTWEIAYKSNYGIELGILDMLTIQADYFHEFRDQIYMKREYLPQTMGSSVELWSNIGKMKSHGIDGSVDLNYAFSGDFWVTGRANFTYATNEVVENGEAEKEYEYLSGIGYNYFQPRGLVAQRLFIDDQEVLNSPTQTYGSYMAGDIKYVDVNNDGQINENDKVPMGYPTVPEIVYGFGASSGYKDFDFSFFFQGSARQSFFIDPASIQPFINDRNALKIIADNHWSDDNPDPNAFWPRLSVNEVSNNYQNSSWWLRNGSFMRLKSVEFGYTLPQHITERAKISEARVYFSGINLLTFSQFKLWDPEMASNGLGYPTQRVYNIGIQVNL